MKTLRLNILLAGILFVGLSVDAQAVSWTSSATGGAITATVTEPVPAVATPALIVYLKNLTCERIGQEPDASILADFKAHGYRVVELDYAKHVNATAPFLNADVLKIRNEIGSGAFPGSSGLNANKNQCYILFEGYRLMRNVPYYLNDRTVYNGAETTNVELHMDIAYPSQPSRGVPIVMEYSCSNSYFGNADDRMSNGNAFTGITDTILEGAPAAGVAWAMADQPKFQQWGLPKSNGYNFASFETNTDKDFNVNYDTSKKIRSSLRVLREVGATLGLSGNIAIHGFSRGATAGSLAIGDLAVPEIDSAGYSTSLSGRAQAVLLGSGIYDYFHSGGTTTGDPLGSEVDIYSRFVTAWGTTAANPTRWQLQGAPYYMATAASAPVFLSYNTDDAAYYVYQAQLMEAKLVSLGVPFQKVTGTGAHHVTTNPTTLTAIYSFFKAHANTLPNKPADTVLSNYDSTAQKLDLAIGANGNDASVMYAIYTNGTPRKWVQANGTVGTSPVWRTLADWGSPVRVGPLTDLDTVRFSVVAYDPTRFTTAQNTENVVTVPTPTPTPEPTATPTPTPEPTVTPTPEPTATPTPEPTATPTPQPTATPTPEPTATPTPQPTATPTPEPTATPTPQPTATPTPQPTATPTPEPTATPTPQPTATPTPEPTATPTPGPSATPLPPAPSVIISGRKKISTNLPKVQIKGSIAGPTNAFSYRVGKGPAKTISYDGSGRWKARISVRNGKNTIQFTASGLGGESRPVSLTVIRKPRET